MESNQTDEQVLSFYIKKEKTKAEQILKERPMDKLQIQELFNNKDSETMIQGAVNRELRDNQVQSILKEMINGREGISRIDDLDNTNKQGVLFQYIIEKLKIIEERLC
jgi:hypothetical protein